jgi:hypothetical protein
MAQLPKHRAQRAHAKRRLQERYGLTVNRHDLRDMVALIQGGHARMIERQSHRVTVWDLTFHGKEIRVVYDNLRKVVVTALLPTHTLKGDTPCSL